MGDGEPYVSTRCRVGRHEQCEAERVVPNCACECHASRDQLSYELERFLGGLAEPFGFPTDPQDPF